MKVAVWIVRANEYEVIMFSERDLHYHAGLPATADRHMCELFSSLRLLVAVLPAQRTTAAFVFRKSFEKTTLIIPVETHSG